MYSYRLSFYTDWRGSVYVLSTMTHKWYAVIKTESVDSICPYPFKKRGKQLNKLLDFGAIDQAYFALFIYRTRDGKVQEIVAHIVPKEMNDKEVFLYVPDLLNELKSKINSDTTKLEMACIKITRSNMDICKHNEACF